jgi:hypothetical protein
MIRAPGGRPRCLLGYCVVMPATRRMAAGSTLLAAGGVGEGGARWHRCRPPRWRA